MELSLPLVFETMPTSFKLSTCKEGQTERVTKIDQLNIPSHPQHTPYKIRRSGGSCYLHSCLSSEEDLACSACCPGTGYRPRIPKSSSDLLTNPTQDFQVPDLQLLPALPWAMTELLQEIQFWFCIFYIISLSSLVLLVKHFKLSIL